MSEVSISLVEAWCLTRLGVGVRDRHRGYLVSEARGGCRTYVVLVSTHTYAHVSKLLNIYVAAPGSTHTERGRTTHQHKQAHNNSRVTVRVVSYLVVFWRRGLL